MSNSYVGLTQINTTPEVKPAPRSGGQERGAVGSPTAGEAPTEEVREGLKYQSEVWALEIEKVLGDRALVWLWIDYYETKFEGYLLVPIAILREWLGKDDIPEYYDWRVDYIIGETLVAEDCEYHGVVCYRLKNYARRVFVNPELYPQLRQYINYIPSEWAQALEEGKIYPPDGLPRITLDHVESPTLRLSEEEEERLAEIDRKLYGCPYFHHGDYYHISHILKYVFLGEVETEKLTEEEKDLIERIGRRVDDWWDIYVPKSEIEYDIEFEHADWNELGARVYTTDGKKNRGFTISFKRVGDGWTLITDEEKDFRESILEFLNPTT